MTTPEPANDPAVPPALQDDKTLPIIIYALHLAGLVTGGVTSVVAVILAYLGRKGAPEWLQGHYAYQIRTFWIALAAGIVGGALTWILIGWVLLTALGVWIAVRCILGLSWLIRGQPNPNPQSWIF